jgi:hypothetical protein
MNFEILNLQTRVRFPVALPDLNASAINYLTPILRQPQFVQCAQFCARLCALHHFISLVDCPPDLLQAGMLVKPRHIHFAVAHRIHHGYEVAGAIHCVGTQSVPSTMASGRPANFLAWSNCFCTVSMCSELLWIGDAKLVGRVA